MEAPRLTLLPFLDRWDSAAAQLTLNVMTIPIGDPRAPLNAANPAPAAPNFVGSDIVLSAHISQDALSVPTLADVPATAPTHALSAPAGQTAIFNDLAGQFNITQPQEAFVRESAFRLKKYLPKSYREQFSFTEPKTALTVFDDSYLCALRCPPDADLPDLEPTTDVSWGDVFAMLTRHPAMARAAGLLHTVTLDLAAGFSGGWVFFSLDNSSPFAAQVAADPEYLRLFATRVPVLSTSSSRPVFTAVSFPVAADAAAQAALGPLDTVFDEAISFDDGFAKIVHVRQPNTSELAADDDSGLPLSVDPGIQCGWDDEDVSVAMNRGISDNPDGSTPPEAPSGVAGYRVDVRRTGDPAWSSLCQIESAAATFAGVALGSLDGELNVEVQPVKLNEQFWLPAYFTRWEGGSLVAPGPERERLAGVPPAPAPTQYTAVSPDAVPLEYGQSYDFRVRLADPAGGGPVAADAAVNPGTASVATIDMRRKLRPTYVELENLGPDPARPNQIDVLRPKLGYPAALFTGHSDAFSTLTAIAVANDAIALPENKAALAIPDPDVALLRVDIFVEMPGFDKSGGRDGFRRISRAYRAFPPLTDLAVETPLNLQFDWTTAPRLSDVAWENALVPSAGTGAIQVPTARNIRIEARAIGRMDLTYFATEKATIGERTPLWEGSIRVAEFEAEPLFGPVDDAVALTSVYLQPERTTNAPTRAAPSQNRPSPLLLKRWASALEMLNDQGTIYAPPGRRVVFSCNGLTHVLAPDASSFTPTGQAELSGTWLNTLRVPIARDWSWIGLAEPGITVERSLTLIAKSGAKTTKLSRFSVPHSVNIQASEGEPDRDNFELAIIDSFQPPLDANGFPHEIDVSYVVKGLRETGETTPPFEIRSRLPVTTRPRVAPRIISAGHALSPYAREADYAETGDRKRRLWLEFTEDPRQDPRDIVYGRVVAAAPDPMLLPDFEPDADPPIEAELDLDPEVLRVITPGQAEDFAGLSAMQPLIPSPDSRLHYAVPIPPSLGPGSPELFGFFTMEFRIGHPKSTAVQPFWSTAQGRFGPPIVLEGVQFPAPPLQVSVTRDVAAYRMTAFFAQPVRNGRRVPLARPNSDIWFVLYARVMQADGKSRRNIQLLRRSTRANPKDNPRLGPRKAHGGWSFSDIETALSKLGLPADTPLSALAVELLPEPNGVFADPLGGDLGDVRILRTSRLIEMPQDCCVH